MCHSICQTIFKTSELITGYNQCFKHKHNRDTVILITRIRQGNKPRKCFIPISMIIRLGQKKRASHVNKGKSPEKQSGSSRISFPLTINYEVDIEGEKLTVDAEKQAKPHSITVASNIGASQKLNFEV